MNELVYKFSISEIWRQVKEFPFKNSSLTIKAAIMFVFAYVLDSIFSHYIFDFENVLNFNDEFVGMLFKNGISEILNYNFLITLACVIISYALYASICGMIFRKLLLNQATGFLGLKFGKVELLIFAMNFLSLIWLNYSIFLKFLVENNNLVLILLSIIIVISFFVISCRFFTLIPDYMIENKLDLRRVWFQSKGNFWNFFGLSIWVFFILAMLFIIIIIAMKILIWGLGIPLNEIIIIDQIDAYMFAPHKHQNFVMFLRLILEMITETSINIIGSIVVIYAYKRVKSLQASGEI